MADRPFGEAGVQSSDVPLETGSEGSLKYVQPVAENQNCTMAAKVRSHVAVELTSRIRDDLVCLSIEGLTGINTFSCLGDGWKDCRLEVLLV
jgi:hypothetical protein